MSAPDVKIKGMAVSPLADLVLSALICGIIAISTAIAGRTLDLIAGVAIPSLLGGFALLFATESYLFSTFFFVRELDPPYALRWVELGAVLLVAKIVACYPTSGGLLAALVSPMTQVSPWVGFMLLAFAWWQGQRMALVTGPLHPEIAIRYARGIELNRNNDHGFAFDLLRGWVLGLLGSTMLVAGIGNWIMGTSSPWGWSPLSLIAIALGLASALVLLIAAQLRQRITWAQDQITPPDMVIERWIPMALPVLVLPLILALLIPAGPRLPIERLLALLNSDKESGAALEVMTPPTNSSVVNPLFAALERISPSTFTWPPWLQQAATSVLITLGVLLGLRLIRAAAQQFLERLGSEDLRGILALLALLASWYVALWQVIIQAFGGSIGRVMRGPLTAIGAAFSEAGLIGRYIPRPDRSPRDARAAVRYAFVRLEGAAVRRGIARPAATTAHEYGTKLGQAAPAQSDEVARLTTLYDQARYSDEVISDEQASFARRAWLAIARALWAR